MPLRVLAASALIACGAAPSDEVLDPDDSAAAPDDSVRPPTATARPTGHPTGDTSPPAPPSPPVAWGDGLVDISTPLWVDHPFDVFPGALGQAPPQAVRAFFADLDEDGAPEAVFGEGIRGDPDDQARTFRVFRYHDGSLELDPVLSEALEVGLMPPSAALDLDGDGHPDLLGASASALVRWAEGTGRWGPWTPAEGAEGLAPGDAWGLYDIDADGWLDLLLGDYRCSHGLLPALRVAPRRFEIRRDLVPDEQPLQIDAIAATRLADGTSVAFAVASSCPLLDHPGFYRWRWDRDDGYPELHPHLATPDDAWWTQRPEQPGGTLAQIAAMGGGFTDLDADGHLDLVVTTGVERQAVAPGLGDGRFGESPVPAIVRDRGPWGVPEYPWSVAFPDLDQDGRGDVLLTIGDDGESWMALRGHTMANALYWNAGGFGFVDVSDEVGLVHEGSWHALGTADWDADGDADLIVGGYGNLGRAYRNLVDTGNQGLSLALQGTTSNRFGIGARVEVRVPGLPVRTMAMGALGNFDGVSEPRLFAGLGTSATADIRVHWPSGLVQDFPGRAAGTLHTLVEAPLLEVRDADRHAPADGTSTITVRVTPRDATGAPRRADVVATTLGVPVAVTRVPDGDRVDIVLTAPTTPGSTVLSVRIDGVEVGVRPRLWWDDR